MEILLKHIATIQTGAFAKPGKKGNVVYLHTRYFDEDGMLTKDLVPDLYTAGIFEKHILRPGDVLFAAKGAKNFATCFNDPNMPAIASTSFFVIRIQDESVLPRFLAWYINHPATMKYLKTFARGTSIVSIPKKVLSDLSIPIPSLEKQQLIVKIDELRSLEKKIETRLSSLRQVLYQQRLFSALD